MSIQTPSTISNNTNTANTADDFMQFLEFGEIPVVPSVVTTEKKSDTKIFELKWKLIDELNEKFEERRKQPHQITQPAIEQQDKNAKAVEQLKGETLSKAFHKKGNSERQAKLMLELEDKQKPILELNKKFEERRKQPHQITQPSIEQKDKKVKEVEQLKGETLSKTFYEKGNSECQAKLMLELADRQKPILDEPLQQRQQEQFFQQKPKSLEKTNERSEIKDKKIFQHNVQQMKFQTLPHKQNKHNTMKQCRTDRGLEKVVEALSKVTGLPTPKMIPSAQKEFVENAVVWLRENEPNLDRLDDETIEVFTKLAGVSYEGHQTSPDEHKSYKQNNQIVTNDYSSATIKTDNNENLTVLLPESRGSTNMNMKNRTTPKPGAAAATTITAETGRLSELSKQLRVLQNKNDHYKNEVDRIERQLRIMSDHKGVSVKELRRLLQEACQEEAHNELCNQVLSLQAQLDAIHAKKSLQTLSDISQESAQREMASLQLRVGELEEIEEKLCDELQTVYQSLQEQTSKATKSEANVSQLKAQIQQHQQDLESYKNGLDSAEQERDFLLREKQQLMEKLKQTELDLKLEKDKNKSLSNQMEFDRKLKQEKLNLEQEHFQREMQQGSSETLLETYKADEDLVKALSTITGLPMPNKMKPEEKKMFVRDSINYLRKNDPINPNALDDDTIQAFSKLAGKHFERNSMSILDQKRKAMKDALKWFRSNELVLNDDTLNWIRTKDTKRDADPNDDPVRACAKVTGLPIPKQLTPFQKEKFVYDSIDWLRNNDPKQLEEDDDATVKAITKLANIDLEERLVSQEERKRKAMQDALTYIRNNDPTIDDDPDEELLDALSKVTGLSKSKKMTPIEEKIFVANSVEWLCKNDPENLGTVDDVTAKVFTNIAGIDYFEENSISPEDRRREAMRKALEVIRNDDDITLGSDPDKEVVEALSKITGLPMADKMSPFEKKKFAFDTISCLRKNDIHKDLEDVDDMTAKAFTKLAGIDYEGFSTSPEERKRQAMQDALYIIRNNDPKIGDPTEDTVKALSKIAGLTMTKDIAQMTPFEKKKVTFDAISFLRDSDINGIDEIDDNTAQAFTKLAGINYEGYPMPLEERKCNSMEYTLDYIRNNDVQVDENPTEAVVKALSKITGLPMPRCVSRMEKKTFVDESLDWLRKNDPVVSDTVDASTADAFNKIVDIPYRGNMTSPEERKQKVMQDALDWIRSNLGHNNPRVEGRSFKKTQVSRNLEKQGNSPEEDVAELYEELHSHKSKVTTLEATCEEQSSIIEAQSEQIAKEKEALKSLQRSHDWAVEEHNKLFKKLVDTELELNLEKDKAENFEQQLSARKDVTNLKKDQHDSRFTLQQEQIADREQQLSSLYTAFGFIQDDCTEQEENRVTLQSILGEADSRVARQLQDELENETTTTTATTITNASPASAVVTTPTRTTRTTMTTSPLSSSPGTNITSSGSLGSSQRRLVTPETFGSSPLHHQPSTLVIHRSSSRLSARNLSIPNLDFGHPPLMEGYAHKYDSNVFKGWKKRYFSLRGNNGQYGLTYSTGPLEKIKGTIPITMGISTIRRTTELPLNHPRPYVLELRVNPNDPLALVVFIGTNSEQELKQWMGVLNIATESKSPQEEQEAIDHHLALQMQVRTEIV